MQNVFLGRYVGTDGTVVEGPSLRDLLAATDPALAQETQDRTAATMGALGAIVEAAEGGLAYDMMLEAGNAEGEALIMAGVEGLIAQTRSFERAIAALGLDSIAFEGSDSLDAPDAVFQ